MLQTDLCEIIASHEVLPDLKAYFIGAQSKYGPQESQSIKEQLMIVKHLIFVLSYSCGIQIGLCEKREVKQLEKISNIEKRMQSLKDNLEKMLKLQYEKTTKEIQQHALFAKFRMSCDKDPHYKNAYSSLVAFLAECFSYSGYSLLQILETQQLDNNSL